MYIFLLICLTSCYVQSNKVPIIINTWGFKEATQAAWDVIKTNATGIDGIVAGCSTCEQLQCDGTVGYGGSPDESGETTLDALIFDGATMDMGAVGALRKVKNAIGVAKYVLKHTKHSLIVGDQATEFAKQMGFKIESLATVKSKEMWSNWKKQICQPNYWLRVEPDNAKYCGPYSPLSENNIKYHISQYSSHINDANHDTIGMVIIDSNNDIVAGTSTNGLKYKIPGRIGDSPIPGAGAYADNDVGGAAATGDGDIMLRFLPSFVAVEEMRRGARPMEAAKEAINRIIKKYPNFFGGVVAVNKDGEYGAACNGMETFPFSVANNILNGVIVNRVKC